VADDLHRRIRNEVYHAKTLVRATRNHTKTTAAALHDSEERLDLLIAELEDPQRQGGLRDNGKAHIQQRV
jgi:hypothetical protein